MCGRPDNPFSKPWDSRKHLETLLEFYNIEHYQLIEKIVNAATDRFFPNIGEIVWLAEVAKTVSTPRTVPLLMPLSFVVENKKYVSSDGLLLHNSLADTSLIKFSRQINANKVYVLLEQIGRPPFWFHSCGNYFFADNESIDGYLNEQEYRSKIDLVQEELIVSDSPHILAMYQISGVQRVIDITSAIISKDQSVTSAVVV
jgi:hypothetical protein